MTGVDIFVLFVLPTLILAGSLAGLAILNHPTRAEGTRVSEAPAPPASSSVQAVTVRFDMGTQIVPIAANE